MHYVYILKCSDNSFYIGSTSNIKRRMLEHKEGLSHYTKSRLPITLEWYSAFKTKEKSIAFELYLKRGSGNAFYRKRLI